MTLEACLNNYTEKGICVILENGIIVGEEKEKEEKIA